MHFFSLRCVLYRLLSVGVFLYQSKEHILCLLIYVSKLSVETSAREQIGVCDPVIPFQTAQMPLSPYPDRRSFFG